MRVKHTFAPQSIKWLRLEMKIAIVHDELIRRGGAEQVTYLIHQAFPEAPIYTSSYNPELTYDEFKQCEVRTSWFTHIAKSEKVLKRLFYPFGIWAMQGLKLEGFDVVFMSTTTCAKFVKIPKGTKVIAFCHYPFRLAWFPNSYEEYRSTKGLKRWIYDTVIARIKQLDLKHSKRIDWYITNTPHIAEIIKNCYHPQRSISVIPASIALKNFYVCDQPSEAYYLVVSRLESHKKVDLVIKAFNDMPDKKLLVIGRGSERDKLHKLANSNTTFEEGLTMKEIADKYANCKALLFPQEEDFGLVPIETNASGRPIIAYGKGGVTYTTIPYSGDGSKATALFFDKQSPDAIMEAVHQFETISFDPAFIRAHAERFSEEVFVDNIRNFVLEKAAH
jgi:glycosyltransferase involved in cell wall biosynthesis